MYFHYNAFCGIAKAIKERQRSKVKDNAGQESVTLLYDQRHIVQSPAPHIVPWDRVSPKCHWTWPPQKEKKDKAERNEFPCSLQKCYAVLDWRQHCAGLPNEWGTLPQWKECLGCPDCIRVPLSLIFHFYFSSIITFATCNDLVIIGEDLLVSFLPIYRLLGRRNPSREIVFLVVCIWATPNCTQVTLWVSEDYTGCRGSNLKPVPFMCKASTLKAVP